MNNILDAPEETNEAVYIKKSVNISRAYLGILVLTIVLSVAARMVESIAEFLTGAAGLAVFVLVCLSPFGLYYTWKSMKRKEGQGGKRLGYGILHGIIFLVFVGLMTVVAGDMYSLFFVEPIKIEEAETPED